MGHCLGVWGSRHEGIDSNPATFPDPSTFQITDLLPLLILEMANFSYMAMTERGTVHFMDRLSPWFLVTQEDLDTGRIKTFEFKRNGRIRESFRRRAYNMFPIYLRFCTLGKPLSEVKEGRAGGVRPEMNAELDMTQPIIDILEGAYDISKTMNVSTPALTSKIALDNRCTSLQTRFSVFHPSVIFI